jgi:hypothetical protein
MPAAPAPAPRSGDVSAAAAPLEAERRVATVLNAAARADDPAQERAILEAAENVRRAEAARRTVADTAARRLNEEANRAYWIKKDVAEALQLERRAFEVNPGDVEIAGNLAFYYLKQSPPHAEAAREVALHALTTNSPRYRTGRLEDWMSLGIASALMGRRQESENAFLAGAALGNNLDRTCRAALTAVATYGDAVRPAATALLRRVRAHGRSNESPYCAWPPDWTLARRYP